MNIEVTIKYIVKDVRDWYEDEKLTKKETLERLAEDFADYSVCIPQCEYERFQECTIKEIK